MLLELLQGYGAGQGFPCMTDLKFKIQNMLVLQIEKCCNSQHVCILLTLFYSAWSP